MSKQRTAYRIGNWGQYNKALIQRGSINLWVEHDLDRSWYAKKDQNKQGRPFVYDDYAMELCLTLKTYFKLTYRSTQGFVASVFQLGNMPLRVPCYTQMARRAPQLNIKLKRATSHKGDIDIVIDSTGLKVYGEGEWKVKKHGASKRRTWKKLHLGIDPLSHEVYAQLLTGNNITDSEAMNGSSNSKY